MKRSVNFGGMKGKKGRYARSVAGFVDLAKWVGMSDEKIVETVDRRRHPREMTVESLDRDIMLMTEMLELREEHADYFWNSIEAFFNQQVIDRLRARIPELVKMKEDINEQD